VRNWGTRRLSNCQDAPGNKHQSLDISTQSGFTCSHCATLPLMVNQELQLKNTNCRGRAWHYFRVIQVPLCFGVKVPVENKRKMRNCPTGHVLKALQWHVSLFSWSYGQTIIKPQSRYQSLESVIVHRSWPPGPLWTEIQFMYLSKPGVLHR
jgi:hypothetical protein